jgi:hypothetical protein
VIFHSRSRCANRNMRGVGGEASVNDFCHAFYVTIKGKHNTTLPLPTDV